MPRSSIRALSRHLCIRANTDTLAKMIATEAGTDMLVIRAAASASGGGLNAARVIAPCAEFFNWPIMPAVSRKLRQRLSQLRLAYGLGKHVDLAELDRLIVQLSERTQEHKDGQMLRASVLFQENRFNECIAALDHLISNDPSNAEARIFLAVAHRTRGIEDAQAALTSVNPDTLNDDDRSYYWFELLQTELAAWDPRSLSATLDRMPEADQKDETLQLLLDEAKTVLNYVRAHSTKGAAEAQDK